MSTKKTTLSDSGYWYKGNTHCHTTCSDGSWDPKETAQYYRENGYSFLFISDHRFYNHHKEFETSDFLVFPAVEQDVPVASEKDENFEVFHIVGAYDPATKALPYSNGESLINEWKGLDSVQKVIDDFNVHGNLTIFAHPVWSRNTMEELLAFKGLVGIEIFNNVCEVHWNSGLSTLYWDLLWKNGIKLWGFAVDDSHNPKVHALGGWVVVKAKNLSYESIMKALRDGSFYSSTGPELFDFYVEDDTAYVECSDATAVHFITYNSLGKSYRATSEKLLTCAQHKLSGNERFVRAEIADCNGKSAWSNPIWLK